MHDELTKASYHITSVVADKNINNAPPFGLAAVELNPESLRNTLKTSAIIFAFLTTWSAHVLFVNGMRDCRAIVVTVWLQLYC